MITEAQARVLRHLSKSWCYEKEMLKEASIEDVLELIRRQMVRAKVVEKSNRLFIRGWGRAALAEYEAAQAEENLRPSDTVAALQARITQLEAENEAYRAAMKPFADDSANVQEYLCKGVERVALVVVNVFDDENQLNVTTVDFKHAAEVYAKFEGADDEKSK